MEKSWCNKQIIFHVLASLVVLSATGCCLVQNNGPVDSGFLPSSEYLTEPGGHVPFDVAYVPDPEKFERAKREKKSVCIQPVVTEVAEQAAREMDLPPSWVKGRIADLRELGSDLEAKLKVALTDFDPGDEYDGLPFAGTVSKKAVCEYPGPDSLVWELALVEVSPNIPVVSVLATLANHFLHGTAIVRALGAGSVVVEGILRDGATDDVLLIFRDRQGDKISLFSVRNYTVYGHTRRAFSEIAQQVAELSYAPSSYDVPGSWIFTFNPL